ncbi:MAG: pentapeptide repeat-containing protein [Cyanobacteria bacterium J06559_3]
MLSRKQLAAAQEQSITDRFSKAVEQLGYENSSVRIGGIHALERIAQDSLRFWKANLAQANLSKTHLSCAVLEEANLSHADLTDAILYGADLQKTNLESAIDLTVAQIKSAKNWRTAVYNQTFLTQLSL